MCAWISIPFSIVNNFRHYFLVNALLVNNIQLYMPVPFIFLKNVKSFLLTGEIFDCVYLSCFLSIHLLVV